MISNKLAGVLLTSLAIVLVLALTRMLPGPSAAGAQLHAEASQPTQMAVDQGLIYVLQDGRISVYTVDDKITRALLPGKIKLRLLATQDLKTTR